MSQRCCTLVVGALLVGAIDAFRSPIPLHRFEGANVKDRPSFANAKLFMTAAPISTNPDLLPGIAAIDAQNHGFYEHLHELREKPFFRMYSVDMLASCEYMPQELFECYSETCEIYPVDDDDVSDLMAIICIESNVDG
jgi:hypothetical protein